MQPILYHLYEHSTEYKTLEQSVNEGITPILVHGSELDAIQWLLKRLHRSTSRDMLLIFDDDNKAKTASENDDDIVFLPSKEMVWFDAFAHSNQTANERIEKLIQMKEQSPTIVSTAIQNLAYKYPVVSRLDSDKILIDMDTEMPVSQLQKTLFELGYERVDIVEAKGQYALRGGILDIFSTCVSEPYRIEFFGDEVDSIRTFDIESQKSIDKCQAVTLYPAKEVRMSSQEVTSAVEKLQVIKKRYREEKRQRVDQMLESLQEGMVQDHLDPYFSILFEEYAFLTDYLKDPIIVIISNNQTLLRLRQYTEEYKRQFTDYLDRREVVREQYGRIFDYEEILLKLSKKTLILDELLIKKVDYFKPQQMVKIASREINKYYGKFEQVALDIKKWKLKGYKIVVVLYHQERLNKFVEVMSQMDIPIDTSEHYDKVLSGQAVAMIGNLAQGFLFDTFKAVVLTENELYGEGKRVKRQKSKKGKVIKAFTELSVGDFVVHEGHGVGKYMGVEQMTIDGTKKDFLKIRYAQDDHLYIPVESASLIQKYVGTDKEKLKLNRLGGSEWKKTKSRAQKAIDDMTDELIALYSERQKQKGFAFDPDNEWQREFEGLFPYQETKDQLRCIEEIKEDMQKAQPMERLLCGDVGYGKTEVALRAAFKAVLNSKQVAILVPTTILAQQHYNNTVERFSKYPAKIEMLSRFRSKGEQEKIIEDIRTGVVDVIIGTHRILSNDVKFKNLGLLIIDEEQRFGVKHKEKIKMLKEQVDVLTLSATPIPRTLHMSMIGIRDMSVIEDPPEDRYPIQTYVVEYDDYLIREALVRELERGGQVYFVHNRVSDIDKVALKINQLVPNARVEFAHGQMNEHRLEKIMIDFMNHEFDILVCTTIIETGLDISNVNTIIINDGDRYGLSQLYQLRGRVGRSNRLAYCYIFYKENKVLSEVAEKRLRAIKEFTELGAGFKIAMRDLEIRGAGNVLGTQQHGHMEAIGYDLYCKLLEESMMRKKGEVVEEVNEAKIDIPINAYIPENYISHPQMKIEIYKKIASIDSKANVDSLYEEIEDRFGTVPNSVNNLMRIAYMKHMLERIHVETLTQDKNQFVMTFVNQANISPLFIADVMQAEPKMATVFAGNPLVIKLKITNRLRKKEEQLTMLENFIEKLYSLYSDYVS